MATYPRRRLREKVLQCLYAYEISKEPLIFIQEYQLAELKVNPSDFKFAKELIEETVQHGEELDTWIKLKAAHWELDRIALIDKIILRMGICEMLYFPDIPPKVTINEAIEIVKSFSSDRSGSFVNGVLDSVFNDLKSSGRLNKLGRGLINERIVSKEPADTPSKAEQP